MFGHHFWVQAKSDVDDPDLMKSGGFERQVRGRIMGSLILIVILIIALVVVGATNA